MASQSDDEIPSRFDDEEEWLGSDPNADEDLDFLTDTIMSTSTILPTAPVAAEIRRAIEALRVELVELVTHISEGEFLTEKASGGLEGFKCCKEKIIEIVMQEQAYKQLPMATPLKENLFESALRQIRAAPWASGGEHKMVSRTKYFVEIIFDADRHVAEPGRGWGQKPLRAAVSFDKEVLQNETEQAAPGSSPDLAAHVVKVMSRVLGPEAAAAAIGELDDNHENILHLALKYDLPGTEYIIRMAGERSFRDQRISDGNTPLHGALKFSHFIMKGPRCAVIPAYKTNGPLDLAKVKSGSTDNQAPQSGTKSAPKGPDSTHSPQETSHNQQEQKQANTPRARSKTPLSQTTHTRTVVSSRMCKTCWEAYRHTALSLKTRCDIVQALLDRDAGALSVRNLSGVPPYVYLDYPSEQWRRAREKEVRQKIRMPQGSTEPAVDRPATMASQSEDQLVQMKSVLQQLSETRRGRDNAPDAGKPGTPLSSSEQRTRTRVREPIPGGSKIQPGAARSGMVQAQGPPEGKTALLNIIHRHAEESLRQIDIGSKRVLNTLKQAAYHLECYERTRDALFRGTSSIATPDPGVQSEDSLDLEESSQRVSALTTKYFNFLQLEHVMASVTLSLRPTDQHPTADTEKEREENQRNLLNVFKWLKKTKKVEEILRLTVKENPNNPCSDYTVKACLHGLSVRYLNWDRPDLCANKTTLPPSVLELDLYWSGLDSVLWSWSDTEGLRTLPELRRIRVHFKESRNEREDEDKEKFKAFQNRISQWPGPRAYPDIIDIRGGSPFGTDNDGAEPVVPSHQKRHPWIKKAENFAQDVTSRYQARLADSKLSTPLPTVRVALLDDGVDPTYGNSDLGSTLHYTGWPRVGSGEHADSAHRKFYVSESQHGSKMASLIHKVCPFATIYVAKLCSLRAGENARAPSFKLSDAVEAINWAVSQNVDIISMSWYARDIPGSDASTSNTHEVADLEIAIRNAMQQNILMFGAACDDKTSPPDERLVPCDLQGVWSIGATDLYHDPKKYVDVRKKLDYLLPGEHVLDSHKANDVEVGNSGATALAAGLAAMVLFLARAEKVEIPEGRFKWMENVMDTVFKCRDDSKVVHLDILETNVSRTPLENILNKFKAA